MNVLLNGAPATVPPGSTVADVVADRPGVAVALNGEVVPRPQHPTTAVHDGDVVEVVTAVQGG